jgi:A/G-specific adenine glycosylase
MYIYHYHIDVGDEVRDSGEESLVCSGLPLRKWVATGDMEGETLSTGMRKCWELVAGDS